MIDGAPCENYLKLAEDAFTGMNGPDVSAWISRLEAEHDKLHAELMHYIENEDAESALRMCAALRSFWWTCGYIDEGLKFCISALAIAETSQLPALRAEVLNAAGVLARMSGNCASAREYHEQSLAIRLEIGDKRGMAACFNGLGNLASDQGEYGAAWEYHEQSLAIKREIGDRKGVGGSLNNVGYVAYRQRDYPFAKLCYEQSLTIRQEYGNPQQIAQSLQGFAEIAAAQSTWERAVRLWGAADSLRVQSSAPLTANEQAAHDAELAAARQTLGDQTFSSAWDNGRIMSLNQSIEYALEHGV